MLWVETRKCPVIFGFLHGKFRTPHVGVIVLTIISAIIGSYGVLNADNLVQVAVVSNIGTFILYGVTCIGVCYCLCSCAWTWHLWFLIARILGAVLNIAMLVGVVYFAVVGGDPGRANIIIAEFLVAWLVIRFLFLVGRELVTGVPILHPEDYKAKVPVVSVIRSYQRLQVVSDLHLDLRLRSRGNLFGWRVRRSTPCNRLSGLSFGGARDKPYRHSVDVP